MAEVHKQRTPPTLLPTTIVRDMLHVAVEPAQPSPLGLGPPTPPPKSPRIAQAQESQPQPAPIPPPQPQPQPLARQRPLEIDAGKKEDWRRSDATMASHHTIRPRSGTVPRPVSMAESTSTVMAQRRLSALVAEAEFVLPDDDDAQARRRFNDELTT